MPKHVTESKSSKISLVQSHSDVVSTGGNTLKMFSYVKIFTLIPNKWLGLEKQDRWASGDVQLWEERAQERIWKPSDTERIITENFYSTYFLCLLRRYGKANFIMVDQGTEMDALPPEFLIIGNTRTN